MNEQTKQDQPYSNRELREKWHDIQNDLQKILTQTTLTNGRVKDLEIARARSEGFYKALAIFSIAAWAVLGWLVTQTISTGNAIQRIEAKLSAYEIQIK